MTTIEFKFDVGQSIEIISLKLTGTVIGFCKKYDGPCSYYVIWWSEGSRHDEWLYEFELDSVNGSRRIS